MLNKSRYQGLTAQRQYDIPGASLRGPYKRWIPQSDNRQSESETEGPKLTPSSSHRTRGQYTGHAAGGNTVHAATTTATSSTRDPNTSSTQQSTSQKQRPERTPYGYSSESTIHAPVQSSKHTSSSFSLFKPHVKESRESRGHSSSATRREELPRSTTAPAAVPSKYSTSQPMSVPAKSSSRDAPIPGTAFGSLSTQTSTDPSPRSSTDSGPRSGHASAPAAEYSQSRKQGHAIWNPYVDARLAKQSTSRPNEASQRRDDKRTKDKEDMVARVTEALGGGSTGRAKVVERALLQDQVQTVRRDSPRTDDVGYTRRTTSSTGTRGIEAQPHVQSQPQSTLRRHKNGVQSTPLAVAAHLPDLTSKSSRPSTTSSRGHHEIPPRAQGPPEPLSKILSSSSKIPASSSSKAPHVRTASSPWPFNQALPPEQATPKPQTSQGSKWTSFSRFHGQSTHSKPSDPRPPPPPKDTPPSHESTPDAGRSSQTGYTPFQPHASKSSLSRSAAQSSYPSTSRAPPPVTTMLAPPSTTRPRADEDSSYATMEQPQRWSPNAHIYETSTLAPAGIQGSWPTPTIPRSSEASNSNAIPVAPEAGRPRQAVTGTQAAAVPPRPSETTITPPVPIAGHVAANTQPVAAQAVASGTQQSSKSQSFPWASRHPDPNNVFPGISESTLVGGGHAINGTQSIATGTTAETASGNPYFQNTSLSPWPTSSRYPEAASVSPAKPEPPSGRHQVNGTQPAAAPAPGTWSSKYSFVNATAPNYENTDTLQAPREKPMSHARMNGQPFTPSELERYETTDDENHIPTAAGYAVNDIQPTLGSTVVAWSSKYSSANAPPSTHEKTAIPKASSTAHTHQPPYPGTSSHPPTSPELEMPGRFTTNGAHIAEKHIPGAWTSKYSTTELSVSNSETLSTPKPPAKAPIVDGPPSASLHHTPATNAASESAGRSLRYPATNGSPADLPVSSAPGAWTTSSRYATNTTGSIFDAIPATKSPGANANARETSATVRQATLGTVPVAGAWTTRPTPANPTPSSSESTLKQTPMNTPTPSSLPKPQPASGTNTGTSTPSSAQISNLISQLSPVTSHSISTRVPISGHPSTPAPVRPALRPTPPPLSISSTSHDTDSLLTPSSLNSPRSTMIMPQTQPAATITTAPDPPEKDSGIRKTGFFDFFRPKPTIKSYEVWTPPSKEKDRRKAEATKEPTPTPKPKSSVPVPIPSRPKSPKIFSPFKLFSKRHRTVSTASLDVLDGTAPNTVMNSPASSMRADTPGAPPSPPIRDAILATQEWRNKEASDLVVSGRKRRHRPGVTFDCPEDIAPADIVPSRLRVTRLPDEYDDY